MKVALVRRSYTATGGAELYLQRLMEALVDAGHDLHLFAASWESLPAGVQLHSIPVAGSRANRLRQFVVSVQSALAREPFDCVFSLERISRQDVYRAGDGVHRVWLEQRRRFAPWWRNPWIGKGRFHRLMLQWEQQTFTPSNTRRIIVNSQMVKDQILRYFPFPKDRIHLVRNGVNVERFRNGRRDEIRKHYGIRPDDYLLLFVGSGWERKGLRYLLRAMRRLRDQPVKLLVVGRGRRPVSASDSVIFAGSLGRVEDAYAAADLMVFLPIYEPSANVCSEAMAAGLPVVTTRFNGTAELIREQVNGTVLSNPADLSAVTEAIDFWRQKGRVRFSPELSNLSIQDNVRQTLEILQMAAEEKTVSSQPGR